MWLGGWLEKWGFKLISTQVVVEVEVGVELGNSSLHLIIKFTMGCLCPYNKDIFGAIQSNLISEHLSTMNIEFWIVKNRKYVPKNLNL